MRRAFASFMMVAALASPSWAGLKSRITRIDVTHWPTVQTYLDVSDSDGRPAIGLGKDDVKLVVDSNEQGAATALKTFDQLAEPVSVVVVAQVTGAMNDVIEEIKRGSRAVIGAVDSKTKSKVALLGYAGETKRLSELGPPSDADSAAANLAIDTENPEVHMLEAVRTAIDLLNAAPPGQRKLIVLFSDGINNNLDRKAFVDMGKRAAEAGIVVDTIGYAPFEQSKVKTLGEIAKQSNGTERQCKTPGEVMPQFQNVADEIRKEYQATFEVALNADGKSHDFQVMAEFQGKQAYSNTAATKIPATNFHPAVKGKESGGTRWWLWVLIGVGVLALILLVLWLVFRERDEEFEAEEPAPAPVVSAAPQPAQKQRTIALDGAAVGKPTGLGWIVATSGRQALQTFKFKPGRTLIGTGQDCDIVIDDQYMSSHHCEVRVEPNGSYKLVDLGSTNGIVVNEKKVREHELVDNDQFRLGRTEFKFKSIN